MSNRAFDSCLGGLLLAVSLPVLAFTTLRARLSPARRPVRPAPWPPLHPRDFEMHRAVRAYEELIDEVIEATVTERRD